MDTELSWCAGFIDGEGYFNPRHRRIEVTQVERAPLERCQRMLGGNITGPYVRGNRPNASPIWHWHSSGCDAERLLETVVPLMTPGLKRDQATERLGLARVRAKQRPRGSGLR